MILTAAVSYLFLRGVGIWGINIPVAWGFAIVNFVWWIGIGHAGTFISAMLFLMRQDWRTSINRFAEAMTLFAVACAGMFPLLHLGRPWEFFWLLPYPNTMWLWPQFRSPLVWDVFAVSTYVTISLVFWYVGLDSRSGDAARQNPLVYRANHATGFSLSAGAVRPGTGSDIKPPIFFSPAWRRRWSSPSTASSAWISPPPNCPAGTARSSRPISSPAPSFPDSPWS